MTAAIDRIAERAVAMAKAAPADPYAGIAAADEIAKDWPQLDMAGEEHADAALLRDMALTAEAHALKVKGVSKSGGAAASSSGRTVRARRLQWLCRQLSAHQLRVQRDRDRRRRHRHGARL